MSNITESLNQRVVLISRADFTSEGQKEIIKAIMKIHGVDLLTKVEIIDENDDYDSFLVEGGGFSFCVKISFDQVPIFYEYMVLKGIEHLQISPFAVDRREIEIGNRKVYYTIQNFEYSENLFSSGKSSILDIENSTFNQAIKLLHTYQPPKQVHEHLDDISSYLNYNKVNFNNILQYIEESEALEFNFIKSLYEEVYQDMNNFYLQNAGKLTLKNLVHGNLNSSTIIHNSNQFKFINFENCFLGSPYFDLINLVFELQMSGMNEFDFITKKIKAYNLTENRLKAGKQLEEYKVCKYIWTRKKFLDLICQYIKEILILNKTRQDKIYKLSHNFSNHFYRFNEINGFLKNKDIIVNKFSELL